MRKRILIVKFHVNKHRRMYLWYQITVLYTTVLDSRIISRFSYESNKTASLKSTKNSKRAATYVRKIDQGNSRRS